MGQAKIPRDARGQDGSALGGWVPANCVFPTAIHTVLLMEERTLDSSLPTAGSWRGGEGRVGGRGTEYTEQGVGTGSS